MATVVTRTHDELFARPRFLNRLQCARLREAAASASSAPAGIVVNGMPTVDVSVRRTREIGLSECESQLGERLDALMPSLERRFGVRLAGWETPRVLRYVPGDYFRGHRDRSDHAEAPEVIRRRRISAVLFLNGHSDEASPYRGGELVVYRPPNGRGALPRRLAVEGETGLLVAFSADEYHEVTSVRWGERYTAVTWFH